MTVRIDDVRLVTDTSHAELSARIAGGPGDTMPRLWFRVPVEAAEGLSAGGDAFLPVPLLAAMAAGAALEIEAPVSAALLGSTRRIMRLYDDWCGLGEVAVTAPATVREPRVRHTGAFFSGGVDSFYIVLKNLARYPVGAELPKPERIRLVAESPIALRALRVYGGARRARCPRARGGVSGRHRSSARGAPAARRVHLGPVARPRPSATPAWRPRRRRRRSTPRPRPGSRVW